MRIVVINANSKYDFDRVKALTKASKVEEIIITSNKHLFSSISRVFILGLNLDQTQYRIYSVSDDSVSTLLQTARNDVFHCIDLDENLLNLYNIAAYLFFNYTQVKMPKAVFNQSLEGLKVLHSYMLECDATTLTEEQFFNNLLKDPFENLSSLKSFFTKLPSYSW